MLNAMYLFSIRSNFKHMNVYLKIRNRTEQNINVITLKLLQFLVTHTTIYNFGDKTGHNNNG